MDTLKDELELAVPHLDPGPDGVDDLVTAGRRAVRRRRTAAVGLVVGGGLVAATVAFGASSLLPADDGREAQDPAAATATPAAPDSPRPSRPEPDSPKVRLTLDDVLVVHGRCGRQGEPKRTDQVWGEAWAAVEFACGDGVVRVLRAGDDSLVGRYRAEPRRTLGAWAEANVDRVAP